MPVTAVLFTIIALDLPKAFQISNEAYDITNYTMNNYWCQLRFHVRDCVTHSASAMWQGFAFCKYFDAGITDYVIQSLNGELVGKKLLTVERALGPLGSTIPLQQTQLRSPFPYE